MKDLKEFLAAYVGKYGSAKVFVAGDQDFESVSGVTRIDKLDAENRPDIYIVNNAGINGDIAKNIETVAYSSDSDIIYSADSMPNAGLPGHARHKPLLLLDNFAVFSKNQQLLDVAEEPEVADVADVEEPEVAEEWPEGFPVSITGSDVEPEDEENEDEAPPTEPKVW